MARAGTALTLLVALALPMPSPSPPTRRRPPARRAARRSAIVDFGSDGRIGAKWNAATATIAYGRMAQDGHYHAFIADGDGGRERRVAFAAWRDDRHQFPGGLASGRRVPGAAGRAERARAQLGRRDPGLRRLHRLLGRDAATARAPGSSTACPMATTTRSRTPRSRPTAASSSGPSASRRRASGRPQSLRRCLRVQGRRLRRRARAASRERAQHRSRRRRAGRRDRVDRRRQQDDRLLQHLRHARTCSRRASTRWTSRAASSTS